MIIYLPSVLLLILALVLPPTGRNLVGKINGREIALSSAFLWTIFVAGFHLLKWIAHGMRGPTEAKGFDILPKK